MCGFPYLIRNNAVQGSGTTQLLIFLFTKVSGHPLTASNATPGAQGYYVHVQHKIAIFLSIYSPT